MNERTNSQNTHTKEKIPTHTERYLAEQARRLYEIAPANIVGSGLITLVLMLTLWDVTDRIRILIWLVCQAAVILFRFSVVYSYRKTGTFKGGALFWKRKYVMSMTAAGLSWGCAAFFLFPETSLAHQFFLTLLLAGSVASASSTYVLEIRTYLYFSTPIFLGLIVRLFSQKTTLHLTLCGMLGILLLFLLDNIHRWNRSIKDSLILKLENLDLRDFLATEEQRIENLDERLQAEIVERQSTKDTLIAERNQLRTLIDNLPDRIFVKDADCRFLLVNKASLLASGLTEPGAFLGKTEFDFFPDHLARKYYDDDRRVIRSGQAILDREERTIDLQTGLPGWRLTSKIPFRDSHGNVAGIVGVTRDITERKLREETYRQHNRELILLNHMSDLLQTCDVEEKTYHIVKSICNQLFASDAGGLYMLDARQSQFMLVASWGNLPGALKALKPDDCLIRTHDKKYCTSDENHDPVCPHINASSQDDGGFICAPISAPEESMGLLYIRLGQYGAHDANSEQQAQIEAKRLVATRIVRHYALFLSNLRLRETLRMEAIHDPLTHLYNRRYMEEFLDREIRHAKRQNSSIGIILFDIDHFKRFNDNYGHEAGDVVLMKISAFIKSHIRTEDIPCRYGGEEFLLILPDIPIELLQRRAEELRAGIEGLETVYQDVTLKVTISAGIATIPDHGQEISHVINAADSALYQAKDGGRNQVVTASLA